MPNSSKYLQNIIKISSTYRQNGGQKHPKIVKK